jgi:hypothetical protein
VKVFIEYPSGTKKRYNVMPITRSDELKHLAGEEMKTDPNGLTLELFDETMKEWRETGDKVTLKRLDNLRVRGTTKKVCFIKFYQQQLCHVFTVEGPH